MLEDLIKNLELQLDKEIKMEFNSKKTALYVNGLVDFIGQKLYINVQKEITYQYATNNGYTNLKYYVDSDATGYNNYYKLLDDIEVGEIERVIIYSPCIFEDKKMYAEKLISTMQEYNCDLHIATLEDVYLKKFISWYIDDGTLCAYKERVEKALKTLIIYSKNLL